MKGLDVVVEAPNKKWSFPDDLKSKVSFGHGLRLFSFNAVLLFVLAFKFYQSDFINIEVWQPVLATLTGVFFINSIFVCLPSKRMENLWVNSFLFFVDALAIGGFIHFLGLGKSFFVFLLLLNIIIYGFMYGRTAAIYLALWTTVVFNGVTLLNVDFSGAGFYMSTVLNDLSFFGVAALSGLLSRQLEHKEFQIKEKAGEVEVLKELNQLIVENIGSGIVTVDLNGRISYANQASERILFETDFFERPLSELLPGAESFITDLQVSTPKRYELEFVNYKEEKLMLDIMVSPLKDQRERRKGYIYLIQDNTELKRMQFAMQQKEKLAAVGQLAAGIAHEIRNPLASISGSVELLDQGSKLSDEDRRLMRIVMREIDRLNGLISEFLVFVRPEEIPETPISIKDLLSEVVDLTRFNKSFPDSVVLKTELEGKQMIFAHKDKLKQAFLNMMINAIQAVETVEEPIVSVRCYDNDQLVTVVIEDNGCGMSEETMRRIFEPFHTTKSKGTGLGMAITHKILESHGAQISIESNQGRGTVFTIDFQVVNNPSPNEKVQRKSA